MQMHFDLVTIRLFIATAETGSVTRAAESVPIALAAASRRLKELEQQFGVPLFQRLPHGMALTDAGRTLLAHARSMAYAVSRMQDDALAFRQGEMGVVRMAACTSAVLQFLPDDLQRCQREFPGIKIDLHEMNSNGVLQALSRGVVDIGICESTVAGAQVLDAKSYHSDRLVLVTLADHPLAQQRSVTLNEMLGYDLIGLTEGSAISTTLERLAKQAGKSLQMRIRVGSFDSMIAMIAQGIGLGVMPLAVAEAFAGAKRFRRLRIDESWATRQLLLCHQPVANLSRAALAVLGTISAASQSGSEGERLA